MYVCGHVEVVGSPQPAMQPHDKSPMRSPSHIGTRHPPDEKITDPDNSHHMQRSNSSKHARIVTLCLPPLGFSLHSFLEHAHTTLLCCT
jgi:hypothetical protein